jgi:hypothetical protein
MINHASRNIQKLPQLLPCGIRMYFTFHSHEKKAKALQNISTLVASDCLSFEAAIMSAEDVSKEQVQ